MGLDRANRKELRPSPAELARRESMPNEALREGFIGMFSQHMLFGRLDGEVHAILRRRERILQSGPNIKKPLSVLSQLAASLWIGRRHQGHPAVIRL